MADGEKKPALSLNQLHNRFLLDRSASQSMRKPPSSSSSFRVPLNDDDCKTQSTVSVSVRVNEEVPRFDFDTPSPPIQGGDLESKRKDPSPNLFAGITDFDSPSPTHVKSSYPHESNLSAKEDGNAHEINPTAFESRDHNNGGKPVKLKIEGRRRLCKISVNNDSDVGAEKSCAKAEEPKFEGISDFDSPVQVNKACESSGSEIRDILNDLSSRLEVLSIEKKMVPPKKAGLVKDCTEFTRSKLYDVIIEDNIPENKSAMSSSLLSSNFLKGSLKDAAVGGAVRNEHQKKKEFCIDVDTHSCVGMTNRTMYHLEGLKNSELMRANSEESRPHHLKREKTFSKSEHYVALGERQNVKQVNGKQGKIIELSDGESEEDGLDDHLDDFTLRGLKYTYRLPSKIAKMLFPHQREGLKWLWSLHSMGKGGILGDDMGLGKTMQICGFIAGLFHSNLIRRVLVVAPKTLLTHWVSELSVVGLSEKTREYFATCAKTRHYELQYVLQDKGILLTTYDIVRNNVKALCGDYHKGYDGEEDEATWDYMILDEGHLIKNPSTQRAKSLLQIPCRHRIIISGTPLQNNLKELWALFNFCCPELLGDKNEFKEKYEYFISRGNEKNASDREKRIGSSVAKNLRDCIQPYFLRRMKSEVFSDNTTLSKKNEIVIWLRLTQCQRQLYEAFLKSEIVISACDGSPLAALTILKKICDHPLLLTKRAAEDVLEGMDSVMNQEDHRVAEKLAMHIADVTERFDFVEKQDVSCKISFVLSLLGDLIPKGHNVLIFSQTRKMLNLLQESLIFNDYQYMRIDGTTKASDRAKIVKDFQEGRGAPIFLLTSQVGGLGLTLTNADRVIVIDPAWNPSTDNQSVDRAYRIGQNKDVIVYRLMTCGTVEEKIYRKQVFKGGLFRSATEHKEQTRYFSQQDLRDLFSLPKQGFDISPTQQQLLEEHDRQHTMEEALKAHVEFLETLNIAGVSQHSLLFSKTAPVQEVEAEEEVGRLKASTFYGNASTKPSREQNVDGTEYAFNPKDVNKFQRNSSPAVIETSEKEIRDKINRLSQLLANKVVVSNLSDKGEKLRKQITALNLQLDQLGVAKIIEVPE
ncbi:protein CHROMATIN REMODELING 24-like isoform X2 [Primulina huaijiensis]|uniref:protein CHROMATIN REMODELING 24-like isoform X2 n=1 Tax=Primulina huaijiensis TaxID=1492673 RepID=UPI003CC73B6B